jgi:hypothetical protein
MVKNPRANGILERVHQVLGQMLHTAELDMADSVTPDDVDVFLDNAAWAICSTYHTVLHSLSAKSILAGEKLVATTQFLGRNSI